MRMRGPYKIFEKFEDFISIVKVTVARPRVVGFTSKEVTLVRRIAWLALGMTVIAGAFLIPQAAADRSAAEDPRDVREAQFDIARVTQGHRRTTDEILLLHKLFTHDVWPNGRLPSSAWITFYFNPNDDPDFDRTFVVRDFGTGLRVTDVQGNPVPSARAAYVADNGVRVTFSYRSLRRRGVRPYLWYATLSESHVVTGCPSPSPSPTATATAEPSPTPSTTSRPTPTSGPPCPHGHTYSNDRAPDTGALSHQMTRITPR